MTKGNFALILVAPNMVQPTKVNILKSCGPGSASILIATLKGLKFHVNDEQRSNYWNFPHYRTLPVTF
jgi:hypothetical protein